MSKTIKRSIYKKQIPFLPLLLSVAVLVVALLAFTSYKSRNSLANAGEPNDFWADVIIGKRTIGEISPREVVPYKVSSPGGVVVDRSGGGVGKLYVWDSGNSRVLGIDLEACYASNSPCNATLVIGQPQLNDYGACNQDASFSSYPNRKAASSQTICGIPESTHTTLEDKSFVTMHTDSSGNLYVPDARNNRVLKFIQPFTTDTVADEVWGQADFLGNGCNLTGGVGGGFGGISSPQPTASSLCYLTINGVGCGVAFDAIGNMWVSDGGNNRVLRFSKVGDSIAKTADLVLGQANFNTGGDYSGGADLNRMASPSGLMFDASGKLYVSDTGNNRVLVFTPPFSNSMTASLLSGSFNGPQGLEIDTLDRGLWVYDTVGYDSRLRLFDYAGNQIKDLPRLPNRGGGGIGIDTQGNILTSTYVYGQNVHRFSPQQDGTYAITKTLFSPPDGYNLTTAQRSEHSGWPGVGVVGNQLVVADGRLRFWNNISTLTDGKAPDGYVGAASETTIPDPGFEQIKTDNANRVWVTKKTSVQIYQAPLSTGMAPIKTITSPLNAVGGGQIAFDDIHGVAPTSDGLFVWLSDTSKSRVFRVKNPLSSNPQVDIVLGQNTLTGAECNRGLVPRPNSGTSQNALLNMLCLPGALSIDKLGNLYVSDHYLESDGNWRLLMFASSLFPPNTSSVLYAPLATKEFPRSYGVNVQSHATFEPAFNSRNTMVVGYNPYLGPRFPEYYLDPTSVNPSNPSDPQYALPDGHLSDFYGWAVAATFDLDDNLYMYDANRGQVRIYKTPFGPVGTVTPTAMPTSTLTLTPTPTPSGDQTAPVVTITNPLNGASVNRSRTTIIRATATDNVKVTKVEFRVNGVLKCTDTKSAYTCNWNVPSPRNITYSLEAKAFDAAGNTKIHTISVTSQ